MTYVPLKGEYSGATTLDCPECSGKLVLRKSYRYDRPFYGCENFPQCNATHGAHPDGSPLGIPANKETKNWRIQAHKAIDHLWGKNEGNLIEREKKRRRKIVYKWLAHQLNIKNVGKDCHIAKFDIARCQQVIEIAQDISLQEILNWYVKNKPEKSRYYSSKNSKNYNYG